MKVAIHQPTYIPWAGFFEKIAKVDLFVILDTVCFEKNSFDNRNRIGSKEGPLWLTVPVATKGKFGANSWRNIEIVNTKNWRKKHLSSIKQSYSKTPFFGSYIENITEIYSKEWSSLFDLNMTFIFFILKELGIKTEVRLASENEYRSRKSDLVLEIVEKYQGDEYFSGSLGKDYLETEKFTEKGIKVNYQDYKHPVYDQVFSPFISHLSVLDVLFHKGGDSLCTILGKNASNG